MKKIYDEIKQAVINAGKMMLDADGAIAEADVAEKNGDVTNLVTKYDVEIQEYLIERILELIPSATFVAEEKENDSSSLDNDFCFIIDPIDGTTNFIHGYGHSCISLAMISYNEVVFAIIYDPYRDEMFSAELGCGAYLNGKRMYVSKRDLRTSIVAYGTAPYYKDTLGKATLGIYTELFYRSIDLRRCGSAALDLAYLAAGRNDAFYEMRLSPWDIAAGALLVKEAGGIISTAQGEPIDLSRNISVISGNPVSYPELLEITKKY